MCIHLNHMYVCNINDINLHSVMHKTDLLSRVPSRRIDYLILSSFETRYLFYQNFFY